MPRHQAQARHPTRLISFEISAALGTARGGNGDGRGSLLQPSDFEVVRRGAAPPTFRCWAGDALIGHQGTFASIDWPVAASFEASVWGSGLPALDDVAHGLRRPWRGRHHLPTNRSTECASGAATPGP
jgi:hypothetical protein